MDVAMRKLLILMLPLFALQAVAMPCNELTSFLPHGMSSKAVCNTDLLIAVKGTRKQVTIAVQYIAADAKFKLPFHRDYIDKYDAMLIIAAEEDFDISNLASEKINNKDIESRFVRENLIIMPSHFNRKNGIWHGLEEHEIELANKLGGLVSISGTIQRKGEHNEAFFKILVQPELESSISFYVKATDNYVTIDDAMSSIMCIEKNIGVNFNIPGIEKSEESSIAFSPTLLSHGNNDFLCGEK